MLSCLVLKSSYLPVSYQRSRECLGGTIIHLISTNMPWPGRLCMGLGCSKPHPSSPWTLPWSPQFLWKLVPVFQHPHTKELIPNNQPKSTLCYFKTITPCPLTTDTGKNTLPFLQAHFKILKGQIEVSRSLFSWLSSRAGIPRHWSFFVPLPWTIELNTVLLVWSREPSSTGFSLCRPGLLPRLTSDLLRSEFMTDLELSCLTLYFQLEQCLATPPQQSMCLIGKEDQTQERRKETVTCCLHQPNTLQAENT